MNIPIPPAHTASLFPRLYAAHSAVLQRLAPEQWLLPTACAGWSVKDVALHMLADDVGWLSGRRDGFRTSATIARWDDLLDFINSRNQQWVEATRRMSPHLLTAFVPFLGGMVVDFVQSLDPKAPGMAINWAGSEPQPLWFETGRELTERWMHHQHICDAAGVTSLKDAEMVHAVLDVFVRAMPFTYRGLDLPDGSVITLWLIGDGGGSWSLMRQVDTWKLYTTTDLPPLCTVSLPVDTAWRLFTKGITTEQAGKEAIIEGNMKLAEPLLHMVSILA